MGKVTDSLDNLNCKSAVYILNMSDTPAHTILRAGVLIKPDWLQPLIMVKSLNVNEWLGKSSHSLSCKMTDANIKGWLTYWKKYAALYIITCRFDMVDYATFGPIVCFKFFMATWEPLCTLKTRLINARELQGGSVCCIVSTSLTSTDATKLPKWAPTRSVAKFCADGFIKLCYFFDD